MLNCSTSAKRSRSLSPVFVWCCFFFLSCFCRLYATMIIVYAFNGTMLFSWTGRGGVHTQSTIVQNSSILFTIRLKISICNAAARHIIISTIVLLLLCQHTLLVIEILVSTVAQ